MAKRPIGIWLTAAIALLFGLLTIKSGGAVLFGNGIAREQAGHYVPFVLWFNFLAGFVYVAAAFGLFLGRRWAAWLSLLILSATLLVFILFGIHIMRGGAYEVRTLVAMTLRSAVWIIISVYSWCRIPVAAHQKQDTSVIESS